MKKTVFVLAVLMLTAPAWAVLSVECAVDGCDVTVSFSGADDGDQVRGMAFDIQLSGDGTLSDVQCLSAAYGYQIFPGDIDIDSQGNVDDWGNCKCSGSYAGTYDDPNAMTIEMGSLYEVGVDADPCNDGNLVSFRVAGNGTIDVAITVNPIRGGVVNEDAGTQTPSITGCQVLLSVPTCWDVAECPGQALGDATCDGSVNALDVFKLKQSWLKSFGQAGYNCCANFNHVTSVNALDMFILKQNWLATGLGGNLNQDCPDPEP
jgi:hypothetical protein